jgi:hypothetical protein
MGFPSLGGLGQGKSLRLFLGYFIRFCPLTQALVLLVEPPVPFQAIAKTVSCKQWSEACKTSVVAQDSTPIPPKSTGYWLVFGKKRPQKPAFFDHAAIFTSFGSLGADF